MIPFEQNLDRCRDDRAGTGGLSNDQFQNALSAAQRGTSRIRQSLTDPTWPLLQLPAESCDLLSLSDIAGLIKGQSDQVVVLGTGGSSLGGQTLATLAPRWAKPSVVFADNLDPHAFAELLTASDFKRTTFLVISKSGGTPEPIAQMIAVIDAFRARGLSDEIGARVIAISQPGENPLRRLAERFSIAVLDHDPALGGRFSVLSCVGLLPAAILGLDIGAVRAGAKAVLDETIATPDSAPAQGAAMIAALAADRGVTDLVVMPYASKLERLGMWYRQLLGESLGKGGRGLTPVAALGPVDQHSMLQLFMDGPPNKMITIITADIEGSGPPLPADLADDPSLAFLSGRAIGDLVAAQGRATMDALARNGRPVRHIRVPKIDEHTLGGLMMHFMLETIILGDMLEVDPFDQPAVELGKQLTRDYLEQS
ncbi:MAG: glucose-6-phosphate isomerase [Alphaproteobacteria bacterium]